MNIQVALYILVAGLVDWPTAVWSNLSPAPGQYGFAPAPAPPPAPAPAPSDTGIDDCGMCDQQLEACNQGVCLPCDQPGRTCCADGTCSNGFQCNPANNTCIAQAPITGTPPTDAPSTDFTVSECIPGGLIVQTSVPDAAIPAPGALVFNPAAATAASDLCTDCGQFGAIVTAVGAPSTCSDVDSCVEVELRTRPALLSELFTAEALAILNVTAFAGLTFFDAAGCSGGPVAASSSRRLLDLLAGVSESGPSRSLLQTRPSTCDGWNDVDSDGRCLYSSCFVGANPSRPNCYNCNPQGNLDCNNGCGAADSISGIAPEAVPFLFNFGDACCNHDYCYGSTAFTKGQCDQDFLTDMIQSCVFQTQRVFIFTSPTPAQLLQQCETYALAYYAAVVVGGSAAEAAAKQRTRQHEDSPDCAEPAPCSTVQRSGGQGTTVLRVDVGVTSGTGIPFNYEMFRIPDQLTIEYEGTVLFTTGGLVSGSSSGVTAPFSGDGTVVTATISAPNSRTRWEVFIGCPQPST